MRWDYSVEPGPIGSGQNSPVELHGTRIFKTLYDDDNNLLVKVETTAEDARANAEPGFLAEYRQSALDIYLSQLQELFATRSVYSPSLSSLAILFGSNMRDTLRDLIVISGENEV